MTRTHRIGLPGGATIAGIATNSCLIVIPRRWLLIVLLYLLTILPVQAQTSFDGLWRSDGYGMLLEFSGDNLSAAELTSISCIPSWTARRISTPAGEKGNVFGGSHGLVRFVNTKSPDAIRMHLDGTVSDILLRRTANRPKQCAKLPANTPTADYAIFWQTFDENYPFFALRKVDWSSIDRRSRGQVTPATTSAELFRIFQRMIEPLQDTHTGLEASDIGQEFDGWRPTPNDLDEGQWKTAQELIAARYAEGPLVSFCKGHLQFGTLKHSIGYLRITAFYDYVDMPTYGDRLHALDSALDSIFKSATTWNGMVIDVRQNHGGDDALGVALASRFTASRYLAYKKVARESDNKRLRFTPPEEVWVEPSSRPGFHGRVILLTGSGTVSAGETLAMALMGRGPHVVRIGLNTQGVFSDVLNRSLPNGWHFHLPNEIYYTGDGKSFDGAGVPPDVEVPFFSAEDIRAGRDSALDKALQIIAEHDKR
jgi:hypothetical protein